MTKSIWNSVLGLVGVSLAIIVFVGCAQDAGDPVAQGEKNDATEAQHDEEEHGLHGGYWCVEHGVPEDVCGICDTQLAADFQKKGDWCDEHGRPDSQCFICHPEYEEKFIAQYEAKFGEKPPARTED